MARVARPVQECHRFTPLTDDVILTYLDTLVSGKANTAIAELAYCGIMYKDALKRWNESICKLRQLSVPPLINVLTIRQLSCTIATVSSAVLPQFLHWLVFSYP